MNKGELLNMLANNAKEYNKDAQSSVLRNNHMNEVKDGEQLNPKHTEAVLVDFLNFVAMKQGMDFGLYTKDLKE